MSVAPPTPVLYSSNNVLMAFELSDVPSPVLLPFAGLLSSCSAMIVFVSASYMEGSTNSSSVASFKPAVVVSPPSNKRESVGDSLLTWLGCSLPNACSSDDRCETEDKLEEKSACDDDGDSIIVSLLAFVESNVSRRPGSWVLVIDNNFVKVVRIAVEVARVVVKGKYFVVANVVACSVVGK